MKCRCAQCNAPLDSRPQSQDGVLIEFVSPCPNCRLRVVDRKDVPQRAAPLYTSKPKRNSGRLGNPHFPKFNADRHPICIVCDAPIDWTRGKPGRVPVFCADHKPKKKHS